MAPCLEPGTYLAGGVAVALAYGHRESRDLDLFVSHDFDAERLAEQVAVALPDARVTGRARGTLHLEVDGIPATILSYRYPICSRPPRTASGLGGTGSVVRGPTPA